MFLLGNFFLLFFFCFFSWFLYEFLTGKELDVPATKVTNYVDLLDGTKYYTAKPTPEKRQKINNNLLGDRRFCPMIRKSETLKNYINIRLDERSMEIVGR